MRFFSLVNSINEINSQNIPVNEYDEHYQVFLTAFSSMTNDQLMDEKKTFHNNTLSLIQELAKSTALKFELENRNLY